MAYGRLEEWSGCFGLGRALGLGGVSRGFDVARVRSGDGGRCPNGGGLGIEVLEDMGDEVSLGDLGDDAKLAATPRTGVEVDVKDALEALHPPHRRHGVALERSRGRWVGRS